MKKSKYTVIITVLGVAAVFLFYFLFPIRHEVRGLITDWIGNDNGFGIKIDNETYALTYTGRIIGNGDLRSIVGHNCILVYDSTLFNPTGTQGWGYAWLVSLTILDSIETR
jgi:hypothetical protein